MLLGLSPLAVAAGCRIASAAVENVYDASLVPPIISLTVDQDEFPINISGIFDISTLPTDRVYLVASRNVDMSAPILQTWALVGTGDQTFPGLSAFNDSDAPLYFEEYIWRGGHYGPRSDKIAWGDAMAPTITSSAALSVVENTVDPSWIVEADEPVTWSITGGADAGSFSLVALSDTQATLTLNATPNFEAKTSYAVEITATDFAGHATEQAITASITNDASDDPTSMAGWNPSDKDIHIVLDPDNLQVNRTGGSGGTRTGVRSAGHKAVGKYSCFLRFDVASAQTFVGLCDATWGLDNMFGGSGHNLIGYQTDGHIYGEGADAFTTAPSAGVVIGLHFHVGEVDGLGDPNDTLWIDVDGVSANGVVGASGGFPISAGVEWYVAVWMDNNDAQVTMVDQTPPAGFTLL